jgi:hypothetical protein
MGKTRIGADRQEKQLSKQVDKAQSLSRELSESRKTSESAAWPWREAELTRLAQTQSSERTSKTLAKTTGGWQTSARRT